MCGPGLALIGLGAAAAAVGTAGSAVGWTGKAAQALGLILVLYGLLAGRRGARLLREASGGDPVVSIRRFGPEFHAMADSAAEGVLILDGQGRIAFVNPRLAEMIGFPAAEIIGRPIADLVSRRFSESDREPALKRLQEGTARGLEIPLRRPGESDCLCRFNSTAVRGAGGPDRGVVVMASDISERRIFEKALSDARTALEKKVEERTAQLKKTVAALETEMARHRQAQQQLLRLSRVFMDAADPIIIEGLDGKIIEMNREAEKAYGWKSDELIGESIQHLFPARRREKAEWLRRLCSQGAEIRDWEGVRQDRLGREIPILLALYPLHDEAGRINAIASIAKDITLRKQMEAVLKESQERLKALSRKSIEALENDRKAVSRELHDGIGSGLAAVKFLLEEVAEQMRGASLPGVALLGKGISHLTAIIKESKRLSVNLRPLSLDDLGLLATIEGYIKQFKDQNKRMAVETRIEMPEDRIPDALKIVLYRILQEALANVARHSSADHILICLRQQEETLELAVEDNGCGFDIEQHLKSKDPFSGFGLKSMRERAEICNGTFSVSSAPGQGTALRIKLPLEGAPQQPLA
jgi:PAS domain S-box-containing protein